MGVEYRFCCEAFLVLHNFPFGYSFHMQAALIKDSCEAVIDVSNDGIFLSKEGQT